MCFLLQVQWKRSKAVENYICMMSVKYTDIEIGFGRMSSHQKNPGLKKGKHTMKKANFYDDNYMPYRKAAAPKSLSDPTKIYKYLLEKVYHQDDYCREAAMILYNHKRGIPDKYFVCGPAGSGKTFVWQCLQEIYPNIIIVDSSNISAEGWKGDHKVLDFLQQMDPENPDGIIVFDEFDKLATPRTNSGGENVSASIQAEFLKLIEGKIVKQKDLQIDTSKMSFILCGSFAGKAADIAEKSSSGGFGFLQEKETVRAFNRDLNIHDLMEAGVIREVASRVPNIINIHPLSEEDFVYLITKHPNSPVKCVEKQYGVHIEISESRAMELAGQAFRDGLGVRAVTAHLKRIINNSIFESFVEKDSQKRKEIVVE